MHVSLLFHIKKRKPTVFLSTKSHLLLNKLAFAANPRSIHPIKRGLAEQCYICLFQLIWDLHLIPEGTGELRVRLQIVPANQKVQLHWPYDPVFYYTIKCTIKIYFSTTQMSLLSLLPVCTRRKVWKQEWSSPVFKQARLRSTKLRSNLSLNWAKPCCYREQTESSQNHCVLK